MSVVVGITARALQRALASNFYGERRPLAFEDFAPRANYFGSLQINPFLEPAPTLGRNSGPTAKKSLGGPAVPTSFGKLVCARLAVRRGSIRGVNRENHPIGGTKGLKRIGGDKTYGERSASNDRVAGRHRSARAVGLKNLAESAAWIYCWGIRLGIDSRDEDEGEKKPNCPADRLHQLLCAWSLW